MIGRPIFCTIITSNYLPYVLAQYESLKQLNNFASLTVLITDRTDNERMATPSENIHFIYYDVLCSHGVGLKIFQRYYYRDHDAFRWSMKPVLMLHQLKSYEKVIYLDWDLHFYSGYDFLFELLDAHSVLLSPHFRSSDPVGNYENYILQFNSGIYNGGFVGASVAGKSALEWWARVCSELCAVDPGKGQYVDQTHLNLLPVYFENIYVLSHRGCNVANWNIRECRRSLSGDGIVRINQEYPVVFIHFTKSTLIGVVSGEDPLLFSYLKTYEERVRKYGINLMEATCGKYKVPLYLKVINKAKGMLRRFSLILSLLLNEKGRESVPRRRRNRFKNIML